MSDTSSGGGILNWLGIGSAPAVTNPDQSTSVGGWTWAPGMQQAGWGLPSSGPAQGLFSGTDWGNVATALKGLQGATGPNTAAGQSSQTPQGVAPGSAQSTLGQPLHRVDPNSVLDVLHRRALGLQQGAMAGPRGKGWGDVQTPVPTSYGLLGY